MTKILFVCLGNICRSTMAEFLMKDMVKKAGREDEFYIASAATSTEALGCRVHRGTRERLAKEGISTEGKVAVQMTKHDYDKYDLILGMETENIKNIFKIIGQDPERKVKRLLDLTENPRDIADPWYTGDFDQTFIDIKEGIEGILNEV